MTSSTDTPQPNAQPAMASNTKPLWAAIGALGMTVVALGGTMLYKQGTPTAPPVTVAALTPAPTPALPAMALAALPAPQYPTGKPLAAPALASNPLDDLVEKPPIAATKPAPAHAPGPAPAPAPVRHATKPAHVPTPATHHSGTSSGYSAPSHAAAAPVCAACGSVESVTPVEHSTKPAGVSVGTVAGGLLGAVLGNQVGHGNGRAAATVLGAVGGGFAGNAIEGKMRKVTVYQVSVRMDNGSRRTLEVSQPPAVGSPVTVEGANLRLR